jgi:hypothetical protein
MRWFRSAAIVDLLSLIEALQFLAQTASQASESVASEAWLTKHLSHQQHDLFH